MDFGEDLGTLATVNVSAAKPVRETVPHDEFFVGYVRCSLSLSRTPSLLADRNRDVASFTNMKFDATQGRIVGLSPTGTRDGEGAFEYGSLDPSSVNGAYRAIAQIPFRAMMDDTDFLDTQRALYWVQASYDKRPPAQQCDPNNDAALCLLSIDSHSGALLSAVHTNWTVYKFADTPNADGSVLALIEGFASVCKHPGHGDFVFGNVYLANATAQPTACLPANVTIQTAQWISSFSADLTQWATASAFGSELQFLSFHTKDGSLLTQSTLPVRRRRRRARRWVSRRSYHTMRRASPRRWEPQRAWCSSGPSTTRRRAGCGGGERAALGGILLLLSARERTEQEHGWIFGWGLVVDDIWLGFGWWIFG